MGDRISIKGLDPAVVLHALYHATRPVGLGVWYDLPDFSVEDARKVMAKEAEGGVLYFEYIAGRPFKMKFEEGFITTLLYDRDAGPGTAQRVIAKLRAAATSSTLWDYLRDED